MENKGQSYTEFEKKLINILISFGKRKDILTVEICREMESKYGHIYTITEMEDYLTKLTHKTGLKTAGVLISKAENKYIG